MVALSQIVVLHRLGRLPNPLAWTPWPYVGAGRFDDPLHTFRALYAAEDRFTCCLEALAGFRAPVQMAQTELEQALAALGSADAAEQLPTAGVVPSDWREARGYAALDFPVDQPALDLRTPDGLETVRRGLRLRDTDLGDVLHRDRVRTQQIARWAYERGYQAVRYPSRFAARSGCWAIFEPAQFVPGQITPLAADDPDLMRAAATFALVIAVEPR